MSLAGRKDLLGSFVTPGQAPGTRTILTELITLQLYSVRLNYRRARQSKQVVLFA